MSIPGIKKVSDMIRLTADLPIVSILTLAHLATKQGVTITESIRRAIRTEHLLCKRREEGNKVLLEKNGAFTELVFAR